jgi:hypothetical protein
VSTEFIYRVEMNVVFETERRGLKVDELEFDYTGTLRAAKSQMLNDVMERELADCLKSNDSLPSGHKNKGNYLYCEFIAQIVGV